MSHRNKISICILIFIGLIVFSLLYVHLAPIKTIVLYSDLENKPTYDGEVCIPTFVTVDYFVTNSKNAKTISMLSSSKFYDELMSACDSLREVKVVRIPALDLSFLDSLDDDTVIQPEHHNDFTYTSINDFYVRIKYIILIKYWLGMEKTVALGNAGYIKIDKKYFCIDSEKNKEIMSLIHKYFKLDTEKTNKP